MELPDNLEGRTITWSTVRGTNSGVVVHDFRGKAGEDVLTRQRIVQTTLMVEHRGGRREVIYSHWIVEVTG
jgi:hypothetical protein